jgi:toxin YoeB
MGRVAFLPQSFEDFNRWPVEDKKVHGRIIDLIKDTLRTPFTGIGKPEPLKHELKGLWSRWITDGHRLVYKVTDEEIVIYSCRYHY